MQPEQALKLIEETHRAVSLFPVGENHASIYRNLLLLVHPDRFPKAEQDRANQVAAKLSQIYAEATGKLSTSPKILGDWIVEGPLEKGDLADLYTVVHKKPGKPFGVLKIVREPGDNDLMDAESQALQALHRAQPENFRKYLPVLVDSFQASGRRVHVFQRKPGYFTLRQIREMMPAGVPFRHISWQMNRLLSVIGFMERAGYVHGAITPDHLLYHPETHGLILVDWCAAVSIADGQNIGIVADRWIKEKIYPQEVLRKWRAGAGTNIYMAARSMMWAADQVPHRFTPWMSWCTAEAPAARPRDAWEAQTLFLELAQQQYGSPTYVPLQLPVQ